MIERDTTQGRPAKLWLSTAARERDRVRTPKGLTQARRWAQPLPAAKPNHPAPQSQSLSRSYGSNLPTSLTYIILSTRGFSPRRPAADMGTSWCDTAVSLSLIFKVPPGTRGHSENCCALRLNQNPFSLREDSRASMAYTEKTTLPRAPADVSDSFRVATSGTRARTVHSTNSILKFLPPQNMSEGTNRQNTMCIFYIDHN